MPQQFLISTYFPGVKLPHAKNFEANRLASFRDWNHPNIFASSLAKAGFHKPDNGKQYDVECCFCSLVHGDWQPGSQPLKVHKLYSPDCPFFSTLPGHIGPNIHIPEKKRSNNADLAELVHTYLEKSGRASTGVEPGRAEANQDMYVNGQSPETFGVNLRHGTQRPIPKAADGSVLFTAHFKGENVEMKYPQFSSEQTRVLTFQKFPLGNDHVLAKQLYRQGFFYTGHNDIVICYFCGLGLYQWLAGDDPKIAHARWSRRCRHLHTVVSSVFIEAIQREMSSIGSGV